MVMYKIVGIKNENAVYASFSDRKGAEKYLRTVAPDHVKRRMYSDKTLNGDSFKILKSE